MVSHESMSAWGVISLAVSGGAGNKARPMAISRRNDIFLDDFMISAMTKFPNRLNQIILVDKGVLVKFGVRFVHCPIW